MSKPVGEMNELDCLRLLIAALVGVNSDGVPTFDQDTGTGGGLTNAQLRASPVPVSSSQFPASLGAKTPALSLSTTESQSSAAPTNTANTPFAAATADADVFTLAAGEIGFIQNRDTDVLVVKLGTGASSSSGSMDLKGCAVAGDGSGGFVTINNWTGVVSVAAATGTASYRAWKI